jgi:hypothetical protein
MVCTHLLLYTMRYIFWQDLQDKQDGVGFADLLRPLI